MPAWCYAGRFWRTPVASPSAQPPGPPAQPPPGGPCPGRFDALLAEEQRARCLLAAGEPDSGLTLLSQVLRGLSQLGAIGDADRVAGILRGHGVTARRAWRGGGRGGGDPLSPPGVGGVQLGLSCPR